ncbi:Hypothetical protein CINCED_3A024898 [Cinara cedri]|uniref:Uncharacterized protein n=1 Tax=Cinara cedri TaxID=506608 RepID=A0A5E4N559_9HEMI|nr:Hypothetical protein CINCED_3A024898 [Cinara cedri]
MGGVVYVQDATKDDSIRIVPEGGLGWFRRMRISIKVTVLIKDADADADITKPGRRTIGWLVC